MHPIVSIMKKIHVITYDLVDTNDVNIALNVSCYSTQIDNKMHELNQQLGIAIDSSNLINRFMTIHIDGCILI